MIMQPDRVTPEVFGEAQATAAKKKVAGRDRPSAPGASRRETRAAQILHIGPYAAEGPTIQRLHAFISAQGYERTGKHHEVYLSDPRRAAPER